MEHMVKPVVLPEPLKSHDVLGVLHHADDAAVPLRGGADAADFLVGEVLADFATVDFFLGLQDGPGEALRLLGLPAGIDDDSPQIAERLKLLSDFSTQTPDLPYLPELIDELRAALSRK